MKLEPLFGDVSRSAVWALSLNADPAAGEAGLLQLRPDCLIGVCHLTGAVEVATGSGDGFVNTAADSLVFALARGAKVSLKPLKGLDALVIGIDAALIAKTLDPHRPGLAPGLRSLLYGKTTQTPIVSPMPTLMRERLVPDMRKPPVAGPAATFWAEGKVQEFIALGFFHPEQPADGYFCSRQNRLARERVASTRQYLLEHLDRAVDLKRIAAHVGCSPHYLSRSFSEYAGCTISLYLRRLRIERAAQLVVGGRHSVSEVAVEVGYQSLSHFSKAFQLEKGCLPSQYDAT